MLFAKSIVTTSQGSRTACERVWPRAQVVNDLEHLRRNLLGNDRRGKKQETRDGEEPARPPPRARGARGRAVAPARRAGRSGGRGGRGRGGRGRGRGRGLGVAPHLIKYPVWAVLNNITHLALCPTIIMFHILAKTLFLRMKFCWGEEKFMQYVQEQYFVQIPPPRLGLVLNPKLKPHLKPPHLKPPALSALRRPQQPLRQGFRTPRRLDMECSLVGGRGFQSPDWSSLHAAGCRSCEFKNQDRCQGTRPS